MPEIPFLVCTGLYGLRRACLDYHPSHIVSVRSPGTVEWDDLGLPSIQTMNARLLCLTFHDQLEVDDALKGPGRSDVDSLLEFVEDWNQHTDKDNPRPLLVHCQLGVSRSTAITLISLAKLNPDASPHDLARELAAASPTARPNLRLVALGDDALGNGGELLAAARSVHRPFNPLLQPSTFAINALRR